MLPFSLKALLPPESQRTSSNWSSKSTLSTHRGRWCNLDLTIFSFQGITFVEEKDLVLLLQQQQKGALGTHCPFSHLFSSTGFLVCELVNERTFTYVTDMSHGNAGWPCLACSCGKESVLSWWERLQASQAGVGFGERESASGTSSITDSKVSLAFRSWVLFSSKNLIHLLNDSNHGPPSSVRHSLDGFQREQGASPPH